jgi:hypothetical protein
VAAAEATRDASRKEKECVHILLNVRTEVTRWIWWPDTMSLIIHPSMD